ncbi:aminoglycoside phosphotransferase family protein [Streptomyces sp. LP05-1]|uniref:Aminoglycoside phosphotransferase family protein n=1 Tax=Streptomyces pyxinae TaxID=2970734 RepID=A0ABT2CQX4_9ACTN|nr:aminoglycoside phosphotransferase family protein [Streptomyces sp. LP05-1]MCS0639845.1 aminoglycoside phosphotransferase family protein [Streptomyces sp. LP05-1]
MIEVPAALARTQIECNGDAGREFVAELPARTERFLAEWGLRPTGPVMHGMAALVVPVTAGDGTPAALKLQLLDEESAGEAVALRTWDGAGAVRLLRDDPATGTLLLERLDERRQLSSVPGTREPTRVLAELLARLTAGPAPEGLRRLGDIAADMLAAVPEALAALAGEDDRRLLRECAAAVREVAGEPGDRLLHWDLHLENVLAADREPWLAIDPRPLAGDPGFELLPGLCDRFEPAGLRWRFDLMTEVLGLDRDRARAWTLGRVLQDSLWDVEDGAHALEGVRVAIARGLLGR